ncbi:hypothetical protein CGLAR1_00715 [Corynebacterium glutamicum]|uniref:hypothetical protein n=1 Tax=Corynebacterium glutamicum TaxID=1718 RepID=UPI0004F7F881|nr:hypothetical protein [Corynebacterium glutamicum]AIK83822.1 hypothetical protein CGLAR1_00715 [Corynebacterium glutamicum]AIK86583.1 hypothetical protein AR0_00710 [Corynebacterium glutamicum]
MNNVQQFHRFFDDSAVYYPCFVPLDRAIGEHFDRQNKPMSRFIGTLILPLAKLEEAAQYTGDEVLRVSTVISTDELADLRRDFYELPNIDIASVEIKLVGAALTNTAWLGDVEKLIQRHRNTFVWVEIPTALVTADIVRKLRHMGAGLKYRTGGDREELFPTPQDLITVLRTAIDAALPFKLTAGLHRALRYRDEKTGRLHFGFLNIAAAVATLRAGKGEAEALSVLEGDDAAPLIHALQIGGNWRDSFRSFSTCNVVEPLNTLIDLDVLAEGDVHP